MIDFVTQKGSRVVISWSQDGGRNWSSRLYVNGGETATTTEAKHKTRKGAEGWAKKILAPYPEPKTI